MTRGRIVLESSDAKFARELVLESIRSMRWDADFSPLRRTPETWYGANVEWRRKEAAMKLRGLLRLLDALGYTGARPGHRGRWRRRKRGEPLPEHSQRHVLDHAAVWR